MSVDPPLPVFIALRYVRARRRNHFISFITLISMLGVAVGVAALITVISVMNGFERELRTQILGMASHATVTPLSGVLSDWMPLSESAAEHPRVLGVAPFVRGEAMLIHDDLVRGVMVQGSAALVRAPGVGAWQLPRRGAPGRSA